MRKIDCMIVGAEKAGTTSLKNYLKQHPSIITHDSLEFSYFINNDEYNMGFEIVFEQYFADAQIPPPKVLLAKSAPLHWNRTGIERLHEHNPACKIIYCLRNPADRVFSDFNFQMENNRFKDKSIYEILEVIEKNDTASLHYRNMRKSFYHVHLAGIYQFFEKENVYVLIFEDFIKDPNIILKDIIRFLQLNDNIDFNTKEKHNVTSVPRSNLLKKFISYLRKRKKYLQMIIPIRLYKKLGSILLNLNKTNKKFDQPGEELRKSLINYFNPHNKKLEKMIHRDLSLWD